MIIREWIWVFVLTADKIAMRRTAILDICVRQQSVLPISFLLYRRGMQQQQLLTMVVYTFPKCVAKQTRSTKQVFFCSWGNHITGLLFKHFPCWLSPSLVLPWWSGWSVHGYLFALAAIFNHASRLCVCVCMLWRYKKDMSWATSTLVCTASTPRCSRCSVAGHALTARAYVVVMPSNTIC